MQGSVAHTLLKVEQLVLGHCTTLKDKSRSRVGGKLVKMYFISYSGSHESSAWRIKVEAECVNKRLTKRSVLFSKYLSPQMWFNTQNLSMNVMFSMTQTQIVLLTKILCIKQGEIFWKNGLKIRHLLASHKWVEWTGFEETTWIFLMELPSWWILAL